MDVKMKTCDHHKFATDSCPLFIARECGLTLNVINVQNIDNKFCYATAQ